MRALSVTLALLIAVVGAFAPAQAALCPIAGVEAGGHATHMSHDAQTASDHEAMAMAGDHAMPCHDPAPVEPAAPPAGEDQHSCDCAMYCAMRTVTLGAGSALSAPIDGDRIAASFGADLQVAGRAPALDPPPPKRFA